MTVMPFRGADPALILRCHGLDEHTFDDATEDAWNDLGGDVAFNFPYLAAELLHAAAEVEDDDELPPPEFAAMSDDRFGKYWVEAVARATVRRMVFDDPERVRQEIDLLALWLPEARRRGLASPVPPPTPRDDRNDLADVVAQAKSAANGDREPSTAIDLLFVTGKTLGEISKAAHGLTVPELVALQAESGLSWPDFIDSRLAES